MGDLLADPVLLGEGVALGVVIWAWLAFLPSALAKRAGVAIEEPPVALYGSGFKTFQVLTLIVLVGLGVFFQPTSDYAPALVERGLALALSLVNLLIVGGALTGVAALYVSWRRENAAVVIEAGGGGVFKAVIAVVILAVIIAAPWAANEFLSIDLLAMLFGGSKAGSLHADLGSFVALLVLGVGFWLIPETLYRRDEAIEQDPTNYRSSGLEFFRWFWLGLTLAVVIGAAGTIPGLESLLSYPVSPLITGGFAAAGVLIYVLFWGLPLRTISTRAAEGDFLANELLPQARFSGLPALLVYRKHAGGRVAGPGEEEKKLCPTCLRPLNDITAYKDFKYDKCPHCASFIPPVFTMADFVKHQTGRLQEMMEDQNLPPGSKPLKKKKPRGVDEDRLVQDLLKALLAMAVSERATDLHFAIEDERLKARYRLDGVLYTLLEFDKAMCRPLISTAKVLANLDITERRKPQDGSFKIQAGLQTLDVRINTSPVADGETAAMRLLYPQEEYMSLDRLGMTGRNMKTMERAIVSPSGLMLVTGPTGSGKSTTLYNGLRAICDGKRNIITLEDPIEVEIKGITQMQINPAKNFTFATGLRTILRQDPDVIMVGEIRDGETAKMAVDAASTGHLVFSTLHSTDSIGVIGRLSDLGADPKRVADVSLLYLAQRLIRLICDHCAEDYVATRETLNELGIQGAPMDRMNLRRGRGCDRCHNSGFKRREGIHEALSPDDTLKALIAAGESPTVIRQAARAAGMRTLLEDGLVKALLGRTTVEELARVTS